MFLFRNSLLLSYAERGVRLVRDTFGKSHILRACSRAYPASDKAFRSGRFAFLSDTEQSRGAWQYRFRQKLLEQTERSLILRSRRTLTVALFSADLAAYGCFGILFGALSAAMLFFKPPAAHFYSSLFLALIITVLSIPLLQMRVAFGHAVRNSFLLGHFFFDFCGLSEVEFEGSETGRAYRWMPMLCALAFVAAGYWVPILYLALLFTALLLLCLLFSLPELTATLLFLVFPWLHLLSHPTLILTFFVLLIDLSWFTKALCGRRLLRFCLLDLSVLLLMLLFLFGGIFGFGGREGFFSGLTLALFCSFWFPCVNLFSNRRWRRRAIAAIKLSAVACAGLGLWQYFFDKIALMWVDQSRFSDLGTRVIGCFQNPNVLAIYLLLTVPFLLVGSLESRRGLVGRGLHFLGFGICLGCLIVTWTRGAWIGFLAASLLCFLALSRRSAALLFLSLPLLLFTVPYLPLGMKRRFASIGSLSDSSIRYRIYTWRGVLHLIEAHPWGIGVGETAFRRVYPAYAVSGIESVMHAHQLLLQITAELGWGGLAVFTFFFLLILFRAVYCLRTLHGEARATAVASSAALLGAFLMGMFDILWYQRGMLLLLLAVASFLSQSDFEGEGDPI